MKQKAASRNIKILVAKLGLDGHDRGSTSTYVEHLEMQEWK